MNQNNKTFLLRLRQPQNLLIFHFFLSAICGSVFLIFLLSSLSVDHAALDTGVSAGRILFLATVTLAILILLIFAFYFLMKSDRAQAAGFFVFKDVKNRNVFLRIGGAGLVFCWIGYFFPSYLFLQEISGYLSWIKLVLLWGILYFLSMIVMLRLETPAIQNASLPLLNKGIFRFAFAAFAVFVFIAVFVIKTGYGISIQEDYWYGAGVPVLWVQVLAAVLTAMIYSWLVNDVHLFKETAKTDMVMFVLIWIVTAYMWGMEPLQPSHFMPDTGINAMYPYSDSATFDLGSQYALIGQGLFNGQYFDRSLYPALLTYLHIIAGQNTNTLMIFQAVVYAVFPAILYLLAKELHGRFLGISLGFLMMCRGVNSIFGASLVDLAGPKMMLTDFPTAIGISLIILFIVKWLGKPGKITLVMWAGCFIGLTLLLRTHAIFLLPFIIAYKVVYFKNRKSIWVYGSLFLIAGMLVSTLPLDFQNRGKGVPIFYMYYSRIQDVLRARYRTSDEPKTSLPGVTDVSAVVRWERSAPGDQKTDCESKLCSIGNHFFHNLAGSVFYLPTSFAFDDFRHTVKESAPYWGKDWAGEGVRPQNYVLLLVNLAIISVGIGTIWEERKLMGLFPLVIYLAYMLSNALAFTSGGRYLVPVDWIICIYYMAGLLKIFPWLLSQTGFDLKMMNGEYDTKESPEIVSTISFRHTILTFAAIFMIGSLVPLTDSLFPRRYSEKTAEDVLFALPKEGLLEAHLTPAAVSTFLELPDARLISGRLLYPRFYASGKGELGLDYPYTSLDYRRLVFVVIGPLDPEAVGVILPIENLPPNLQAEDVIVLGCVNDNFMDAAIVFVLSEPARVYARSTDLVLQCPLPNP